MQDKKSRTIKPTKTDEENVKSTPLKSRVATPGARATKTRKSTLSEAVKKPSGRAVTVNPKTKAKGVAPKIKKEDKPKLIRDSFKFPEAEYQAFDALKARCLAQGQVAKKSELVRAGLIALAALSDEDFLARVTSVEKLKTGRPAS